MTDPNPVQNKFQDSLPFSKDVLEDLIEVGGGNVQQTFISERYGVIHTIPFERTTDSNIALIINRWVIENKPELLAKIQMNAPETDTVYIPKVKAIGSFKFEDQVYYYWLEDFIPGETLLDKTFNTDLQKQYEDLIIWDAMLHQRTQIEMSLQAYYLERIQAFRTIFSSSALTDIVGLEFSTLILRILDEIELSLPTIVLSDEKVSTIHGDLRSKNIILDENKLSVIDFEQGANGGDWFNDLEKLLMLTNTQLPDISKPQTYRPPLSLNQKSLLVGKYIQVRESEGWVPPQFVLDYAKGEINTDCINRKRLFDIDNDLSQLIYNFARGWNFFTQEGQFNELKGTLYLRDKFIRDHIK